MAEPEPSVSHRCNPTTFYCRDAGDEGTNGGYDERPQGKSVQQPWRFSKQNRLTVYSLRQFLSPTQKFRMPQIESYDGVKDPLDHLETFKTLMHLQGVPDEIMCRAFPTTLKGPTRIWFSRLTPSSINTFKELSAQFTSHFIGGHRYKRSTACLMSIK